MCRCSKKISRRRLPRGSGLKKAKQQASPQPPPILQAEQPIQPEPLPETLPVPEPKT